MVIVTFVIVFSNFFKMDRQSDKLFNEVTNIIDKVDDSNNSGHSSYDISSFNNDLEIYQGTKYGSSVLKLLDNVVTKIKKNSTHPITVVYDNQTISNTNDIVSLKKEFDTTAKYEISFDYDSEGFINSITIVNY